MEVAATPITLPGPEALTETPTALLETTFDQLRTLIAVAETGSALQAARLLGREQSSVQKQLDTLNRNFQQICGELLVIKQGRGQQFLFTPSGRQFVALARRTLTGWRARSTRHAAGSGTRSRSAPQNSR